MSYVPPEPQPGPGGYNTEYERGEEEVGRMESYAAEQRLAREAEEATGGTPGEKLWRRVKRLVGTGDSPASGS